MQFLGPNKQAQLESKTDSPKLRVPFLYQILDPKKRKSAHFPWESYLWVVSGDISIPSRGPRACFSDPNVQRVEYPPHTLKVHFLPSYCTLNFSHSVNFSYPQQSKHQIMQCKREQSLRFWEGSIHFQFLGFYEENRDFSHNEVCGTSSVFPKESHAARNS